MGVLEDVVGLRPVYIFAAMVGAVAACVWPFLTALWLILLVRVIDGVGAAATWTGTILAMSKSVNAQTHASAMSVFLVTYLAGLGCRFEYVE